MEYYTLQKGVLEKRVLRTCTFMFVSVSIVLQTAEVCICKVTDTTPF